MPRTQLRLNEVYATMSNMLLFTEIQSENIYKSNDSLVSMCKREGGLYGDQARFIFTDAPPMYDWLGHTQEEANNLLKLYYAPNPDVQQIVIDEFKVVPLTVDQYLTKRAFADEGSFSLFNSTILGWLSDVKNAYEMTKLLSFIGTTKSDEGKQSVEIELPELAADATNEEEIAYNKMVAETVAKKIADLMVEVKDLSREYNDLGDLRSFNPDDLVFMVNADFYNNLTKLGIPNIFNSTGLLDKLNEHIQPPKYFGTILSEGGTTSEANLSIRSKIYKDYNTVDPRNDAYDKTKQVYPGMLLPGNQAYNANEAYTEDAKEVVKIFHKKSIPWLTAFSTATDFFNGSSLTNTHRLFFGHSELEYLQGYPFISITLKYPS